MTLEKLLKSSSQPKQKDSCSKATIIYEELAWKKMCALIRTCDKEVAWHYLCRRGELTNEFIIEDIILFPQTVTGATVTSDDLEYAMWVSDLSDEVFAKINGHGHSHVNMGTSPSGVDTQYQRDMINNGLRKFYIFAIWNKSGSNWHTIYDPTENIVWEDADIELELPPDAYDAWALSMLEQYVTFPENTVRPLADWQLFLDAPDDYPRDDDDDSEFDKYLDEMQHRREMAEFYADLHEERSDQQ